MLVLMNPNTKHFEFFENLTLNHTVGMKRARICTLCVCAQMIESSHFFLSISIKFHKDPSFP